MAENASPAAPAMTREKLLAEDVPQMRNVNQCFATQLPQDKDESLELLTVVEGKISEESPQDTSKIEQDVNCPGQDGTCQSITPKIAISSGATLCDNAYSLDGPASSEQEPELSYGEDKIEKLISGDKELSEGDTTETFQLSVDSKKNHKLDSSTGSVMTEHSKVVKDNGSIVESEELSPEADDVDNKQLAEADKTKSQEKKSIGKKQGSDLKSGKVDADSDSGGSSTKRLIKDDANSPSTKAAEVECVKQHEAGLRPHKENDVSDKDTYEDTSLKEIASATKMEVQPEDRRVSKRKHRQEAEEAPPTKKNKMLDQNLVGSRIKVWWPKDKMFYNGVVDSFNASSKKHKIAYDDGDVEVLLLRKERWEFTDAEQDSDPDAASDMPCGRRDQGSSSQEMNEGKMGTPQIGDPPKKRGRPKVVRSSNNVPGTDSLAVTKSSLNAEETPKTCANFKRVSSRLTRSTARAKDDVAKASNKN